MVAEGENSVQKKLFVAEDGSFHINPWGSDLVQDGKLVLTGTRYYDLQFQPIDTPEALSSYVGTGQTQIARDNLTVDDAEDVTLTRATLRGPPGVLGFEFYAVDFALEIDLTQYPQGVALDRQTFSYQQQTYTIINNQAQVQTSRSWNKSYNLDGSVSQQTQDQASEITYLYDRAGSLLSAHNTQVGTTVTTDLAGNKTTQRTKQFFTLIAGTARITKTQSRTLIQTGMVQAPSIIPLLKMRLQPIPIMTKGR